MNKDNDKPVRPDKLHSESSQKEESGFFSTVEISRKTFLGDFPSENYAFLEIVGLGDKSVMIELREDDVVIGRSKDCEVQLPINHVSRKHALITFRNEEYQIKDLDSTNGIYINGIKVEKCTLRNYDQIQIAGVKIIFNDGNI